RRCPKNPTIDWRGLHVRLTLRNRPSTIERACPLCVTQAEVKWHAITSTMLNDIVQSVVDEITAMTRSGASGIAGEIRRPFELNKLRRQRRNDVAVNSLARIPD